ncbi:hypothetical protein BXZ70DRAFT_733671 [Cristinia sonorae]|uniref:Uncharacterized protein n=1 Tax=Cristinia sonorae TaxID=1940300 RepID=A0A8K0UUD4_9AGAR|nr:hypothetical protein BXZ70DRAFT_733671 [Cristinia sonorae]
MSEKGSPGGSNTTIIIIAVISTVGSLLLLGGAGLIYRWTRRRRMTRVPTEDLALTSKERKRQTFDIGSIDLTVRRPLLQNVPWSSFSATHSDNAMHDSSFTRQGSYMQAYDTGDGSSLQHQIPSRPSYDTHGRDSVIRLHTGHTILAPAPLPTHATLEDDDSMISPTASSVQFHHSNSSSEPALSRSPTTSDHRQSSEVRKLTPPPETSAHASTSSHITSQNTRTSPPVSSSYTEATPSAPSNTPPPRAEQVSPFSDPQPRSRISTALPTPPVSVSSRSRQTSIRPLPRTPHAVPAGIPSPALTPPPIKCQTADMRIAVLSRTVRSADTSEAGGSAFGRTLLIRSTVLRTRPLWCHPRLKTLMTSPDSRTSSTSRFLGRTVRLTVPEIMATWSQTAVQ